MATSNADVHEDDFVSKLNCVRKEVQHGFEGIRNRITDRENIMLQKLNDMESLYTCYKERIEQKTAEMHDIEILIDVVKNVTMTSEFSKNAQDNTLTNLNELLSQIQIPVKPKLVTFVCEPDDLQTELSKFCKLVETIPCVINTRFPPIAKHLGYFISPSPSSCPNLVTYLARLSNTLIQ